MYIAPNSTIKFLSNVPLDDTYENTLFHTSLENQTSTFESFAAYTLTDQSYVRESEGTLRVSLSTSQLYNCNYLMFKNISYENKWFYAFITQIRYRSNGTSYVDFKIDPLQTWYFNFQFEPSFIEREHSSTDNPGDNLVPENLETGEYMSSGWHEMIPCMSSIDPPNMVIVFACTVGYNPNGGTPAARFPDWTGAAVNGIYTGLALHGFDTVAAANAFLTQIIADKKQTAIVCIYMMYKTFFTAASGSLIPSLEGHATTIGSKPTAFPGNPSYRVKNKKLLTAPYIQLYVTNNMGNAAAYPYEYFDDNTITFRLYGNMTPDPAVFCVPVNFKGIINENWDEKMMLKGFPQCAYNVDAFKAWLAQSESALAVSNMSAALSASMGVAGGNPAATVSYVQNVASVVAQAYQHSIMPPQSHGSVSGSAMYSGGQLNFYWCVKYIRPEFVYIIDDYFNRYGYATHRVKLPNVFNGFGNRPHWCFLKTRNAGLKGNIPSDDMRTLQGIFDGGIAFWKVPAEVGNYNLDNSPL